VIDKNGGIRFYFLVEYSQSNSFKLCVWVRSELIRGSIQDNHSLYSTFHSSSCYVEDSHNLAQTSESFG